MKYFLNFSSLNIKTLDLYILFKRNICLFVMFFFLNFSLVFSEVKLLNNGEIFNEKNFSGPMGMGLVKSYYIGEKKICIFNTLHGQKKVVLEKKKLKCPSEITKEKK